jgi:hypothetical protein
MAIQAAHNDDEDPAARLWELGQLKIEYFHDIIKAGEADRRTSTPNDPTTGPGTRDYLARVAASREVLIREIGWKRLNHLNMSLTVNPDKTLAIGVARGDARTGQPGRPHPKTLRPLGEAKQSLVEQNIVLNEALFDLPDKPDEATLKAGDLAGLKSYFLLTRRVEIHGKVIVYCELSRPIGLDKKGRVEEWAERIRMPEVEFDAVVDYIPGTDDGPTFEVNIDEH